MTNSVEKISGSLDKNSWKRKRMEEDEDNGEEVFSSSIFNILGNELQIGELVWTKFTGSSL